MTGAGAEDELIEMLSNVAVARVDPLALVTTSPAYMLDPKLMATLDPDCTQWMPSLDVYPMTLPDP